MVSTSVSESLSVLFKASALLGNSLFTLTEGTVSETDGYCVVSVSMSVSESLSSRFTTMQSLTTSMFLLFAGTDSVFDGYCVVSVSATLAGSTLKLLNV